MDAPPETSLRRQVTRRNVSLQAADIMRDMILVGELKPGQVVTQELMSNRLGVSTMPIREALLRLSHEGFLEGGQNRSFRVAPTSRRDINDIYWMHAQLSGELAARACANNADLAVTDMERINGQWADLPASASPEQYDRLNYEFHKTVNLAANAPKLLILLRHTLRFIPDHFYTLLPEWKELSMVGHTEMVTAMRGRDPDMAREAVIKHVRDAGQLLIGYFTDTGYWQQPQTPDH